MRTLTTVAGIICILIVLLDAFQTVILPRRAAGRLRLTRLFYIATWMPWRAIAVSIRHPRKARNLPELLRPSLADLPPHRMGMRNGFRLFARSTTHSEARSTTHRASSLISLTSTSAERTSSPSASETLLPTARSPASSPLLKPAQASASSPSSWATSPCSMAHSRGAKSASLFLMPAPARLPPPPN